MSELMLRLQRIRTREEALEMAVILARKSADAIALALAGFLGLVFSALYYETLRPSGALLAAHLVFWMAGLAFLRWLSPSGQPIKLRRAASGSAIGLTAALGVVLLISAALSRGLPTPSMAISALLTVPSLFVFLALAPPAVVVGRRLAEPPDPEPLLDDEGATRRHEQALSIVFHELRRPLAALVTASEIALDEETPEDDRKGLLATVQRQALRLSDFMDDLLETARIQSGSLRLNTRPVDLQELIEETREEFETIFAGHELRLKAPRQPLPVSADALKLRMVLSNLLSNAAKYSPQGSTVTVRLFREMESVVCQVEDEGEGVPEPYRKEIFQQFFRIPGTAGQGLGLGLYIARQIVLAHGGTIGVDNGLSRGARFTVTLPALEDSELSAWRERAGSGPTSGRRRREVPGRTGRPSRPNTRGPRTETARH